MDSQVLALEMPNHIDADQTRRELVGFLGLGTLAVWAYAVMATAQTLVI